MTALGHLRVLDLSRILAGPWAGQLLADLGADVVKVERPGTGDDTRSWGPPYLRDADGTVTTEAAYYLSANRNKRSLTLDIATPAGQAVVRQLVATTDVVIENYKVGGLAAYGLDYASLAAVNPRLIYCSITGFGQDGPYAARAGYDFMIQAMSGLMSLTGERDDAGGGPQKVGVAVADLFTGLYSSVAILAALAHRDQTGVGQQIDMALFDVQIAALANQNMNYLTSGSVPERVGNAHVNIVPYQDFATADGHVIVAVGNDGQFARFCAAIGLPVLTTDPRFATNPARVANRAILIPLLRPALATRTTRDWIGVLEAATVPCGSINTIADMVADPQVAARGLIGTLPHPLGGTVPNVANPIRLSATPIDYRRAAPTLGQHSAEILAEAGLSVAEIAALTAAGTI